MPASRNYSSTAGLMHLVGSITGAAASLIVDVTTGLPTVPFTLMLDPSLGVEEVVTVTAVGGTTLTVTRGVGGTSAQAHNNGAEVRHAYYGQDFQDSRDHEASTTAHSATGGIPGKGLANTWTQDQTFSANITAANLFKAVGAKVTATVTPITTGSVTLVYAPPVTGDGIKKFKITGAVFNLTSTVTTDSFVLSLWGGAALAATRQSPTGSGQTIVGTDVPAAGAVAYALTITRNIGTGTGTVPASASAPIEIIVEQIA